MHCEADSYTHVRNNVCCMHEIRQSLQRVKLGW